MAKVINITHTDRDGLYSSALVCRFFKEKGYGFQTEKCNYGNVDESILGYLNSWQYDKEDIIFITDISMSYETALKLDNVPNKVVMIDHHKTALETLGKNNNGEKPDFKWMYIKEGDSATMLVWKYLLSVAQKENDTKLYDIIYQYKDAVYHTDLWDTKSRLGEEFVANKGIIDLVNAVQSAVGYDNWKVRVMSNPSATLTEMEILQAETVLKMKNSIIKYATVYKLPYHKEDKNFLYGVCFEGNYKSDLAEFHFTVNPELLFMLIIDLNGCCGSLRLNERHPMSKVEVEINGGMETHPLDLTVIAKQFHEKGGGHPQACGFEFLIKEYSKIINKAILSDFYI